MLNTGLKRDLGLFMPEPKASLHHPVHVPQHTSVFGPSVASQGKHSPGHAISNLSSGYLKPKKYDPL